MQGDFNIKLNEKLYLKDPNSTPIGEKIVKEGLKMLSEKGYENFTFKKLSKEIPTTEATIYRYFENKHKLLIYLVDWYWAFLEFQVTFHLNSVAEPKDKIKKIIDLLVWEDRANTFFSHLEPKSLYDLVIAEGSKTYLSKEVDVNNKEMLFKPYKDLCSMIAQIFKEYKPNFKYSHSLASTLVETAHFQHFFMEHLPRLCDFSTNKDSQELKNFLENLVFGTMDRS
ncbi:TetR/AcrR family transcriptional regulator [Arcticibacterium luteifluviistationis]|uniref:TetR family transcriptional regulator n=1 Tax=Arcticibacterium luteifluviistationis TaxID=1784714 RepID=A0A2Z4G7B1_9BACT|nr:TetR/AcrR family transcriptional regulator [Arcticibacterium luteifluviistationis]AWV96970.1 TetR family transcriptional regulator [Arcticibacterium luteifluviistationis]